MAKPRASLPLPPKVVELFSRPARNRVLYGGRGSGKTASFALMTAVDGYRFGRRGISGLMLCAREHLASLDESSMQEVKDAILRVPWLAEYYEIGEKYIRSKDRRINYTFTGLRHNLAGVKSKARILRAWIDEAEQVSEVAWRTLIPTVRAEGEDWQSELWISYNPELESSATNQRFRVSPSEDTISLEMNWRDNPWFPKVLEKERQNDRLFRAETYDHIWEGAYLVLGDALVFRDHYKVEPFEVDPSWDGPYCGLDFGFSQDPTAATMSYISGDRLFIRHSFAKKKLDLNDTAQALARAIPRFNMHGVRADSARPESISLLRQQGIPQIKAVKKVEGLD